MPSIGLSGAAPGITANCDLAVCTPRHLLMLEVVAMELPQKLLLRCGGGRAGQVVLLSAVGSSGQVEASN